MIHEVFRKIILFRVTSIIFISVSFYSCSKDSNGERTLIEDIQISISDIELNSVYTTVTWDRRTNPNNLYPYVYYKKSSDNEWKKVQQFEGKIENLASGTKYQVKAVMKDNSIVFESNETTFITPGFVHSNLFGGIRQANSKYSINSNLTSTDFNTAATLSGYFKAVGFDSIPLKDIEILDKQTLIIELPDDTQTFFKNDLNYISRKEFTIGLFSGDYYTEIVDSSIYNEDSIFEEGMHHFNIFNRTPRITSLINSVPHPNCINMRRLLFKTSLWASEQDFLIFGDLNIPNAVSILIYDSNQNILKEFSLNDQVQRGGNINNCTKEMFFYSYSSNIENLFTINDLLHLNLFDEDFPAGTYSIKYIANDSNDVSWESNTLEFQIE